ncbi:thermonuclease family protein [Demequina sp. NBRC 110056]|uniref:thermonuclease family protein n=1 Tax=Demequina sp. NBRC 110056 TaxID=1570345 RepID=UPI000A015A2D|nr:thermonuclease family protein [Demequina sp. NBRC 110056]
MRSMSTVYRALLIVSIAAVMIWGWTYLLPRLVGDEADPAASTSAPVTDAWTVTHVYDGDSMVVERDGVEEDVRVIGIDTPERGECGADEAREAAQVTLEGQPVTLVPGAQDDRDTHDRLLRYVEIDGEDYGYEMIAYGFAIARYDSRTGMPHDREDAYRELDAEVEHLCPDFDGAAG